MRHMMFALVGAICLGIHHPLVGVGTFLVAQALVGRVADLERRLPP